MDSASQWRPLYTFDEAGRERVRALAISPSADVIYVNASNTVMASHDHGASFQPGVLDPPRQEPFTTIAVSPRDSETAFAVGAQQDHPKVYATHDGGSSWQSIHHNLPNASVNAIVIDSRGSRDTLYLGIDGGVYVSTDEGDGWRPYGRGLPTASAKALDLNTDLGVLVVGLNGRSAWRIRTIRPDNNGLTY